MSNAAQREWLAKRKAQAMKRHQGQHKVPGTTPKAGVDEEVFKGPIKSFAIGWKLFAGGPHLYCFQNSFMGLSLVQLSLSKKGYYFG